MLPPLASVAQLSDLTGDAYEENAKRAEAVLVDASSLIRDEAGKDWVTDGVVTAPDVIVGLTRKVAARALDNPSGLTGETYPEYSWRKDGAEDGVYLTDRECRVASRAGGRNRLWTQPTTRLDRENSTVWVDDQYGAEPFPLYAVDDLV